MAWPMFRGANAGNYRHGPTRDTEMILEKEALLLLAWHIKELVKIEKFLTSLFSECHIFVTENVLFKSFQNGICTSLAPESGQVEIRPHKSTPF